MPICDFILRDLSDELQGSCYLVDLVDSSEDALIFKLNKNLSPILVKQKKRFESEYIDSRYFDTLQVELLYVWHYSDLEH